jgi:hypothetical protein
VGYRVGSAIGRLLAQHRQPVTIPAAVSLPLPTTKDSLAITLGRVTTSILGVGVELPFTRKLLGALIGAFEAETFLAGYTVASLITSGRVADPLHVISAALSVGSPLIHIAIQPLLGPVATEALLTLAGVGLVLWIRSRRAHASKRPRSSPSPASISQRWSSGTQLLARSPA